MPDAPVKPCAVCGGECEGKPRLKDPHGRYMHRKCAEAKVAAERGTKKAPSGRKANPYQVAPAGGVMDVLVDDALAAAPEPCPNCGKPCPKDAVLCVKCGFNLSTGKASKTRILKPEKEKTEGGGISMPSDIGPFTTLGIGFGATVVLSLMAFFGHGAEWVGVIGVGVWTLISQWASIAAAFEDDDTLWGWVGISQLFTGLSWIPFAFYYNIFGSTRTALKLNWWCAQIGSVCVAVALFIGILAGNIQPSGLTRFLDLADEDVEDVADMGNVLSEAFETYEEHTPKERADMILVNLSDTILGEMMGDGTNLSAAEEEAFWGGTKPDDYPPHIIAAARQRWDGMSEEEKDELRTLIFLNYDPSAGSVPLEEDFGP